jgi:hypothetical protein
MLSGRFKKNYLGRMKWLRARAVKAAALVQYHQRNSISFVLSQFPCTRFKIADTSVALHSTRSSPCSMPRRKIEPEGAPVALLGVRAAANRIQVAYPDLGVLFATPLTSGQPRMGSRPDRIEHVFCCRPPYAKRDLGVAGQGGLCRFVVRVAAINDLLSCKLRSMPVQTAPKPSPTTSMQQAIPSAMEVRLSIQTPQCFYR